MSDAAIRIRHPATLRTANAIGRLLERCGLAPFALDAARMFDRAEKVTGFAIADPVPRDGLSTLVRSLESEACLSLFGKVAMRSALQRAADSRHRIERAFAKRPDIGDEPIRNPVFIAGAPRSGTTILHALLHLDQNHRAPLSWECLLPYPAPLSAEDAEDERIDTVRREFDRIFRLVPDFRKKHYMAADSPQECLAITALNFTSFQFLAQAYAPSYHEWFVHADQERNLRWHRRFLQFLQSGGVRKPRWLLKSPVHLMRLPALFAVYPDARVIVTHRHPDRIVPSTASIVSSMRSLYSDQEDTSRTGREQLGIWADYFNRFLCDRRQLGVEAQIVDVLFDDFARNQMAVVDSIYARFGWELRAEDRARMESFLRDEPQGKHGVHEYSLAQIGVTPAEIEREYGNYLDFLATRR
ncbi:MAG: sulfotransferase [Pseudomonadales bacterium]|nr:sulfotransferase [Pseudomonadales bacterium]